PAARVTKPPGQDSEGPENELEVGAGKRHQEPLRLLGQEPRIAHVAIEAELEIDEEETHLADVAAKVLTGETMREFVHRRDAEDGQPRQQHRLDAKDAGEIPRDLGPLPDHGADRPGDEGSGEGDEVGREAEPDLADEAVEQVIGVEGGEPQVEEIASHASRLWRGRLGS